MDRVVEPDDVHGRERRSFWHRRRPGIRYIYSGAGIVGGIILVVRGASQLGNSTEATWLFSGGLALIVLGLVSVPVFWWLDRRRL